MNFEAANCANDLITALSQHALWPLEPSHLLPLTDTERKQKHAELLEQLSQVREFQIEFNLIESRWQISLISSPWMKLPCQGSTLNIDS